MISDTLISVPSQSLSRRIRRLGSFMGLKSPRYLWQGERFLLWIAYFGCSNRECAIDQVFTAMQ